VRPKSLQHHNDVYWTTHTLVLIGEKQCLIIHQIKEHVL